MIATWPLIALLFALAAVFLYYAWRAQRDENEQLCDKVDFLRLTMRDCRDENKQLRLVNDGLLRANISRDTHVEAASQMWDYCRKLESRNDSLEADRTQFKDILAGGQLMKPPKPLAVVEPSEELFTVREAQEAP